MDPLTAGSIFSVFAFIVLVITIVSIVRNPNHGVGGKLLWIIVAIVLSVVGSILWLIFGRGRVNR